MKHIRIHNNDSIALSAIPTISYSKFSSEVLSLLLNPECHCVNYFAYKESLDTLRFICCIADDIEGDILVLSHQMPIREHLALESLSAQYYGLHCFEREINENFGIKFMNHPWDKPIRYPHDRANKDNVIEHYPFYKMNGHELHEVGVGPIHAGIIEPGHFRFICNGENVLHLEIQLGYQHRGVEAQLAGNDDIRKMSHIVESIAGDTVVANSVAFSSLVESMSDIKISANKEIERTIALELERIAIHTGDISALCTDIAYQLGSSVLQGLRTLIINSFQTWCGSRFARRLVRPGQETYPLTPEIIETITATLKFFEQRFEEVNEEIFNMPGVLSRFERTGIVTEKQAELIQPVGMSARTCGMKRDIRSSHPHSMYKEISHEPIVYTEGDVWARAILRYKEVKQSLEYVYSLFDKYDTSIKAEKTDIAIQLKPLNFAISLTEGWRGEICHCAITDEESKIKHYKVKDPSLHNWLALALAVRSNDISDFPICNKSFDLSYCGNDL